MSHPNDPHPTTRSAPPAGAGPLRQVSAFSEAAARSYNAIYLTALAIVRDRDTAADITQETFLRAWLKIDTLRDGALLEPWLARIARNTAAQWLRTGQHRSRVLPLISMEEITVEPADNAHPTPRQAAADAEQNAQLTEAVMALPDDLRQAVLLHYAEGMTPSDIARLNGEAPSTVTRRLEKARALLRQHLESGLAASLAATTSALRPRPADLQRTLGLLTAAAAIPAATRAQLLQATADTPPPPMIDAITSAVQTATLQEAGIMKTIIAKIGAAKLIAGAAAIAAVGGGAYSLSSLSDDASDAKSPALSQATSAKAAETKVISHPLRSPAPKPQRNGSGTNSQLAVSASSSNEQRQSDDSRDTFEDRIARLQSERVTTSPQLVVKDGETSGNIHFNLEVVDVAGYPVKGATIKPTGTRLQIDSTGWYGWRRPTIEPPHWTTNEQGIARVYVPQYTEEKLDTGGITFTTSHPDYTPTASDMMLTSITKVVLSPGHTIDVIASDETSSAPITGQMAIEFAEFDDQKPDWSQRSDGTISIRRIAETGTKFYLKHTTTEGKVLVSDYQVITFPRKSSGPLYVTLHPTYSVRGRLSDNVVRPVTNGKVAAHVVSGPDNCGHYATTEADIAADGTFTLENLPAGTVQIWALTDAYSSVAREEKSPYLMTQQFDLHQDNQEYVLPMEPTATVSLKLVDSEGNPAVGAKIATGPNICREGCCGIWFNRYFEGSADATGIAEITGIPPQKRSRMHVGGEWELEPKRDPTHPFERLRRELEFDLAPGQVLEETVTVYPKGTFIVSDDGNTVTTATAVTAP